MPVFIPALAAGLAAGLNIGITTATIIATVAVTAAQLAVSLAISAIAAAVQGGGGSSGGRVDLQQRRQQQVVTSRNPTQTREMVFGKIRKGGTIVFIGTTNAGNDLHLVIALAGHKINSIQEIYFNEDLAFDAAGNVTQKYDTQAFVSKHLGEDDQVADTEIITRLVDNHTGDVIAATQADPVLVTTDGPHHLKTADTVYIENVTGMTQINDREFKVDVPAEISGAITGATVANPVVVTSVGHGLVTGDSITLKAVGGMIEINNAEFVVTTLDADTFELDDEDGTDHGTYTTGGTWQKLSEQFELRDEDGTGHSAYVSDGNWERRVWKTTSRLRGIAYIYLRLFFNSDLYRGIPNVTAILEGYDQVYDPRDDTFKYTSNAALCQAAYLNHATFGLDAPYATEIENPALIAAANACDENAPHPDGTETRYTLNGVVDSGEAPRRNIETLMGASMGTLQYSAGKWFVGAGVYTGAVLDANGDPVIFDENDLRSELQFRLKTPKREIANAVRGVFVGEKTLYQPADFPPRRDAIYLAADNGVESWFDLALPYTESETMAQRIAKIVLEDARREITVSGVFGLKALQLKAGDVTLLSLARMGWVEKPFLVTEWNFTVEEKGDDDSDSAPVLEVAMNLKEIDSAIYDIDASELTTIETAPLTAVESPPDEFTTFNHQVTDLNAGQDIAKVQIYKATRMFKLTSVTIRSQGTAVGIDALNTCEIQIRKNDTTVLTKEYDDLTPFPNAGDIQTLGSISTDFDKKDRIKIKITNGATADPPAFLLQFKFQNA